MIKYGTSPSFSKETEEISTSSICQDALASTLALVLLEIEAPSYDQPIKE